jgi:hypothetical protein
MAKRNRYKPEEIGRYLERYRKSGLSIKAFALRDGINEKNVRRWLK